MHHSHVLTHRKGQNNYLNFLMQKTLGYVFVILLCGP